MTETSGQTYGFDHKTAEDHYRRLGRESLKSFLGPMPVEDFLDTFLRRGSIDCSQRPPTARAFEEVPKKGSTEKRIYKPLVSVIELLYCRSVTIIRRRIISDQSSQFPQSHPTDNTLPGFHLLGYVRLSGLIRTRRYLGFREAGYLLLPGRVP